MQRFYLLDGSMVYQALGVLKSFQQAHADWFLPLSLHSSMGLAAPLLIAPDRALAPAQMRDIARAKQAFPRQLHCSELQSDCSLEQLAAHLTPFTSFTDSSGDRYGLRFADCRVLDYLPQILTTIQWQALTAPVAQWNIATRDGKGRGLPLGSREKTAPRSAPFALSDIQIQKMMEAGEADALLAHLNLRPENTQENQIQGNYSQALQCLAIWKQHARLHPQRCDRRSLLLLARKVFSNKGEEMNEQAMENALQKITASLS